MTTLSTLSPGIPLHLDGEQASVTRGELLMLGTFGLVAFDAGRRAFATVEGTSRDDVANALREYRKADPDAQRIDYRRLILQYIGSCLGPSGLGDFEARDEVLRRIGYSQLAGLEPWQLAEELHALGIRALNGETLADPESGEAPITDADVMQSIVWGSDPR